MCDAPAVAICQSAQQLMLVLLHHLHLERASSPVPDEAEQIHMPNHLQPDEDVVWPLHCPEERYDIWVVNLDQDAQLLPHTAHSPHRGERILRQCLHSLQLSGLHVRRREDMAESPLSKEVLHVARAKVHVQADFLRQLGIQRWKAAENPIGACPKHVPVRLDQPLQPVLAGFDLRPQALFDLYLHLLLHVRVEALRPSNAREA
mmetsp:Transcript_107313/g.269095  ORF Transcript_107313/g.269095 Transcript_107313/m.269095 type:complete len:204 (+) Transcript_107313:846-1457(+)